MFTVSVVIPTYNHARFLGEAIESAMAQTVPPKEVIVIDDGSTDDTGAVLTRYTDPVRVVRQHNQGVAAARNLGAQLATGDAVAFLDADDRWLAQKLERQSERLRAEPELGLIHCGIQVIDAAGKPQRQSVDGLEGWVARELLLFRRPVILGGGSGVIIPREVFTRVGGFDPQLSTSADWDLYFRIARQYKVGFVPEVLLQYRLHSANMHVNVKAMERDMLHAYAKAFRDASPEVAALRRRCYGNLHTVLAGSFFSVGQYRGFIRHGLQGLLLTPKNVSRFLGYPIRKWRGEKTHRDGAVESGRRAGEIAR